MDRIKKSWRTVLCCVLLAAATLATFWPVVHNDFILYDDPEYVTENPHLTSGVTLENVQWALTSGYAGNWHPLAWISHMVDVQIFGLRPGWHHLTSLLLHTTNALLLFLLLQRLTSALWRSAFVAALFALHPLHVESVAWIAERKDVLSGFFFMLTLLAYAKYVERVSLKGREGRSAAKAQPKKIEDRGLRMEGVASRHAFAHARGILLKLRDFRAWHCNAKQQPGSRAEGREGENRNPKAEGSPEPSTLNPQPSTFRLPVHPPFSFFYALALVLFGLGLMSKPMLVTTPFVLLLLDYWPLQRLEGGTKNSKLRELLPLLWEKAPFFVLSAALCLITLLVQGKAIASSGDSPLLFRLGNALLAYTAYLQQTFWPGHLAIFYPYPEELPAIKLIAAGTLVVALSLGVLLLARFRTYAAVGWFWFMGMLVPAIGIVRVGSQARADRYTYLPLIGIFILVAWGAGEWRKEEGERQKAEVQGSRFGVRGWVLGGVGVVLLSALALAAQWQVQYWRDTTALFEHAVEVTDSNYLAWENLGIADLKRGDTANAMGKFGRALEYAPSDVVSNSVYYYMGATLQLQGKGLEALPYLEQGEVLLSLRPERNYRLGLSLTAAGRLEEAEAALNRAIEARPGATEYRLGMAALLEARGETSKAEALFRDLAAHHPKDAQVRRAFGDFLAGLNRMAEAEVQYAAALKCERPSVKLRRSYAAALARQDKASAAIVQLEEALKLEPKDADVNFELGELLSENGRGREAVSQYMRALEARPEFVGALNNLAWLLATDPNGEVRDGRRAVGLAERACELTQWRTPVLLGTLAAAYAETGRFDQAIAMAGRARDRARADKLEEVAKRNEQLLELYRAGKAYHESVEAAKR